MPDSTPAPGGGLRKHRRAPFLQIPSATVGDARLSFRARGVLAWLLDKPDGWDVKATVIAEHGTEGRDAIEAALRELRAAGYYRLERRRLPGGAFVMGTAVAEEAQEAWAAAHAAHDGRAVPVDVLPDGTVVEREAAEETPVTDSQGPASPRPDDRGPADRSPTQTDTQTDTQGGDIPGDVTRAPSPVDGPPAPTCTSGHDPRLACGACAADRRALEAYTDAQVAEARAAVRATEELARIRRAEQRADAELDVENCHVCNDAGIAHVAIDGEPAAVATICQHDAAANRRAVESRLAIRAQLHGRPRRGDDTPGTATTQEDTPA